MTTRPLAGDRVGLGGHGDTAVDAPRGDVTVDDAAVFTARFADGALGSFEASRFALGRKNAFRFKLNATRAPGPSDLGRNNFRGYLEATDAEVGRGFRRFRGTGRDHR